MERLTLTDQLAGHTVHYVEDDNCFDVWGVPKKFMGAAIDRLAAYEDTGLEPEEVTINMEMFAAYRHVCGGLPPEKVEAALRRTAEDDKAREEGRLVVLPCKVGDTLYCVEEFEGYYISEREVGSFEIGAEIAIIDTNDEKICCDKDLGGYAYLSRAQAEVAINAN